jgi:threonine/homoserine/homoserine lactone efflux protein
MDPDYVIFFLTALFVVIGAGLFRVGLMNLKSESLKEARKARLYTALGVAFGIAAVLILVLRVVKTSG